MIDPKELMVGNFIRCLHEESVSAVIVNATLIKDAEHYSVDPDDDCFDRGFNYAPIPLSAQVLEAFGFINPDDSSKNLWYGKLDLTHFQGFYFKLRNEEWELKGDANTIFKPKFLHQIQNFFTIVGQPLEIDLQKLKNTLK